MVFWMWSICVILVIIIFFLGMKIYMMKKSAKEITEALTERLATETNTLIDISSNELHMKKLASEINQQLVILRDERHHYHQGNTELKEAVTNISHDLRTPLAAISGYLELLEKEESSDTVKRYLAIIENRTEALKQLTEELFRYSVIVTVDDEEYENLSINSVLEETIVSFYGALTQRNIIPTISITNVQVERCLNRSALSRIFGNVITNAIKYSDGDLSVSLSEEGEIVFSNTANNLDAVAVGKLFDRFFTVETGKRNSTGLGLSIAKLLTERMGGKISADYLEEKLVLKISFLEN